MIAAWVAQSSGKNSNVSDTTPQLGGLLDTNSNNIQFADNDEAIFGGIVMLEFDMMVLIITLQVVIQI